MIFDPALLQKYRLAFLKLRAISGSSRFFILNIIRTNESINVGKIVSIANIEQPIVSQLLSVLKKANFVKVRADKKEKHYSLNQAEIDSIIAFSVAFTENNKKADVILSDCYPQILQAYSSLKYLLNPGRMILLEFLDKKGETTVGELSEATQLSQSIVSQNLSVLKNLGVANNRLEGRKSIYFLNKNALAEYKYLIEKHF